MTLARIKASLSRSKAARALLYPAILVRRAAARRSDAIRNRIVQNLQECLAEDPVVYLKDFDGTFSVDRRSHLFARVASEGSYEPVLAAACRANLDRSRDAIDVGANIGFFTNLLARQLTAGRVLAIEPTYNALTRLRSNIDRNRIGDRTIVFEGVASDREGTLEISTIPGKEEYSSIGAMAHPSVHGEQHQTLRVASTTIDNLVSRYRLEPGFIKIDVEGAEYRVLRGASATLRAHRPVVLSELSASLLRRNGTSAAQVVEYMQSHGYKVIDPFNPDGRFVEREFGDMLCIPQ